ncbi:hypothetical protein ACQX25_04420 [Corynebacterium diphtheriae]|uniref:hypothetical protein n=1 Tax=Corynebacterium diphtheriae TaxID=1717 RepID=UPI00103FBE8E|nr:hypothetical protein [Corynebacterium diphtheriae]MBG9356246.1 hypothetical protein [Corynebacterium diphtheriae bv. mitis]MBN4650403.1 hypothetical protein [Corynebacterium diphtheriae bv. mitis]MBN4652686.1 hypothetical protein [Corynebacterium diphtheriae bv. mitis]TBX16564.1 hypothetical protein BUW94_07545 [Corynebacterium diphtheriae]
MTAPVQEALFRFRPGALDIIAQMLNLRTEKQLAVALRLEGNTDLLAQLRHGALCGLPMALHVSELMGMEHYIGAWFDQVSGQNAA